ncbi:hypothetical protein [Vibrio sinaloensis]|uniref:hypothetical protein n=1 Tax=Photobacterium sp. (strain ATCC 43367) TaxID=379097 RepID=UPI000ADD5C15|nr:hypothetical protein [Vibrio sinaloensis]
MKKYLIDFGLIPLEVISITINEKPNVDFLVEDEVKYDRGVKFGIETSRMYLTPCLNAKGNNEFHYSDIVQSIIMDYKTFQLFDRTESVFCTTSSKIRRISSKVEAAIKLIVENEYTDLVFNATPHNCNNWVLSKAAEYLGCKVHYFKQSVVPWRYALYTGLSMRAKINCLFDEIHDEEESEINALLNKKRGTLDDALPSYEKERLLRNRGKIYSMRRELQFYRRPDLILNKFLCWRKYNTLSIKPNLKDDYIVFFVHFQPERTTLPEGYDFTQQILAIKTLRKNTPQHIKIYVKEHPSTYTNQCHWKERDIQFYEEIVNIDGVNLVDIDSDQYKLIDGSFAVSSITGTVLFESVVRGVPSIAFGLGPYLKSKMHHVYSNETELNKFINSVCDDKVETEDFDIRESLKHTFSVKSHNFVALQPGTNSNHIAAAIGIMRMLKISN